MELKELLYHIASFSTGTAGKVFAYKEYYFATDRFFLLAIPQNYVDWKITPDDNPPTLDFVFNQERHEPIKLDYADLREKFISVPRTHTAPECSTCDGYGQTTCECCDSEIDCKDCNGTGLDNESSNSVLGLDFNYYFTFGENLVNIHNVDLLLKTLGGLKYTGDVVVISSGPNKPMIIQLEDKFMVTMTQLKTDMLDADKTKLIKVY